MIRGDHCILLHGNELDESHLVLFEHISSSCCLTFLQLKWDSCWKIALANNVYIILICDNVILFVAIVQVFCELFEMTVNNAMLNDVTLVCICCTLRTQMKY